MMMEDDGGRRRRRGRRKEGGNDEGRGKKKKRSLNTLVLGISFVDCVVGVADWRPNRPAVLSNLLEDLRLLEVRHGE